MIRSGKSISASSILVHDSLCRLTSSVRIYLERYQKCTTSEDVKATQEAIINELEQKYEEARRPGESTAFYVLLSASKVNPSETLDGLGEDLLVANPNHQQELLSDSDPE